MLNYYIWNYFLVRLLNPSWSAFLILAFKWSNILRIGSISNSLAHFRIFLINWSLFSALQFLVYTFCFNIDQNCSIGRIYKKLQWNHVFSCWLNSLFSCLESYDPKGISYEPYRIIFKGCTESLGATWKQPRAERNKLRAGRKWFCRWASFSVSELETDSSIHVYSQLSLQWRVKPPDMFLN